MMRKVAGFVAAFTAMSLIGGCAQLQGLLTPQNLAQVQQILKEAGVSVSFKDPNTGETVNIQKKEDVKAIKTKDGKELKEGTDYKFQDGKLIFVGFEQKQTVAITRPDGTTFNIDVEPDNKDQKARFIPNAEGQFNEIDDNADFDKAFQEQQERDKAHRVTVTFETKIPFKKDEVVALGFKTPDGSGVSLPDLAWADEDGKISFDVQALGDKTPPPGPNGQAMQPEDLTKRVWFLVVKKDGKFKFYKFKITKALERADMQQSGPGQPFDPSKQVLPAAQTVAASEVVLEGTAVDYNSEAEVKTAEKIQEPGQPQQPPPQQ